MFAASSTQSGIAVGVGPAVLLCRSVPLGRRLACHASKPSKGKKGGSSKQQEPGAFLSAFDKLESAAADLDPDDDGDLLEGDIGEPRPGKRSINEDDLVSELLAAAGLSDDGLPLHAEATGAADPEVEGEGEEESGGTGRRGRRARRADDPSRLKSKIPDELLPRIAIVGRPNVGKSALFNRLVGKQVAIVYDYPGVTRDRLYTRGFWGDREFMLVDTGGLMSQAAALPREQQVTVMRSLSADGLPLAIERQAAAAVEESDAIVVVVDGQTGPTSIDEEVVTWLRRTHPGKSVTLAVNKCENVGKADEQAAPFWEYGLEPIAVSAISGSGTGELLDRVVGSLPPAEYGDDDTEKEETSISIAIVGRPNVGKSSLLNALVGKERSIVSDMAGTTRDAIDTDITTPDGRQYTLIDTAGVRRRAAIASTKDGAEPLSVERAFRAVRRAEVAVLVIDATEGITQQDYRLAEYVAEEGRACVVAVNKWDAVPAKDNSTLSDFELNVRAQLRPVEWANVVFISAKTGQRVPRVLDAAEAAAQEHRRRVTTATLNMVLQDATGWRLPPSTGSGRRGRIYYGTQAGIKPPTFVLFCNDPKLFGEDYRKYMERQFRENVGFPGTPLRLYWRGKATGGGATE